MVHLSIYFALIHSFNFIPLHISFSHGFIHSSIYSHNAVHLFVHFSFICIYMLSIYPFVSFFLPLIARTLFICLFAALIHLHAYVVHSSIHTFIHSLWCDGQYVYSCHLFINLHCNLGHSAVHLLFGRFWRRPSIRVLRPTPLRAAPTTRCGWCAIWRWAGCFGKCGGFIWRGVYLNIRSKILNAGRSCYRSSAG